jgi:hypothetical protein
MAAQQKFALVIGNGAYTGITRLNNPVNDAADVSATLRGLGFTVDTLTNAGRVQMEDAVTRLRGRLAGARGSYGFFYYAGHGVQSNGENYLIPVDANIPSEAYLRDRTVSMQAVLGELNDAGNALNIVVLDACRNNPFGWARSGSRGLQVVTNQPADSIIVYATSAGSAALDGEGRNGFFTTHLLNNLKTPGISIRDLFDKTGADVRRASNGGQIPAIYSQFFETAYLGTRPAPAAAQPAPQPAPIPAAVDVYVAGYEVNAAGNRVACYWKNEVRTALSDGRTDAEATAVAAAGSDVYVAGYEYNAADKSVACYWKNRVKTTLSDGSTHAAALAVAVSGNDVYAAGYEYNAAYKSVACYWKNGVKTALSDGRTFAEAWAIAVSGNAVYIAGYEMNAAYKYVACYWKNGVKTALSDGSTGAVVYAVAVSGNDVYIAGYEVNAAGKDVACYWKNGVRTALSVGSTGGEANAITVSGNAVYAAGYERNAAGKEVACYWKNGVRTALSDGSTNAEATAMVLVPR